MPDTLTTNSPIIAAYRAATPGSAAASEKASRLFPSGVTHDSRYIEPYGLYITRAQGPRKWDVDGHCYVDYFGGHGALLLGHGHPKVVEAVQRQIERGTHFGASHETEIAWAEWVMRLVPSAERVRFTSSGTEATMMAVRLARAFTGKSKFIRFKHHFHGWHDHMTAGYSSHFDGSPTPGVLPGVTDGLLLAEQNDAEGLARLLEANKDVAAAILEPTGAHGAQLPIDPKFLTELRELTRQHGVVLIFDEVVTGFRVAPGGAQAEYGIRPDLTTLAKILAGGLPGAIAGRKDILDLPRLSGHQIGRPREDHPSRHLQRQSAVGRGRVAALEIVGTTDACAANRYADDLRRRVNEVFEEEHVPWAPTGMFSTSISSPTPTAGRSSRPVSTRSSSRRRPHRQEPGRCGAQIPAAMMTGGVDFSGSPGASRRPMARPSSKIP
jgi:glutamate-1-semialdehyde 2,1-aminomutase